MHEIVTTVRQYLRTVADPKLAESGQRYFKTPIKMYGTKTADIEKYAKEQFTKLASIPKHEVFAICEEFWKSGYIEESFIACNWSYRLHDAFDSKDIEIFEQWIKNYVNNWASCDTLCNHSVGAVVEQFPACIDRLKKWANTDHLWLKRAAAVSLIIPARKGLFKTEIIEIADILLLDKEDLVQKGYGWMLKAASQHDEQYIFNYVMDHKQTMPRTALRYAIEKMNPILRRQVMER